MNDALHQARVLTLKGAFNFRDIGGLPTQNGRWMRRGLLFRSDELSHLTPEDVVALQALKLHLVCDLRTPNEVRRQPSRLDGLVEVRRLHLPIQPQEDDPTTWEMFRYMTRNARALDFHTMVREYYHKILFQRTAQVGQVFCLLSDPANLPALVHCTVGKDRTGLIAALVQLLVGVPHEVVVDDYLLTNQLYAPRARLFTRLVRWMSLFRVSNGQLRHLMEAHREYLEEALEQVYSTFGSVEAYLQVACQVPGDNLARLQELLVAEGH